MKHFIDSKVTCTQDHLGTNHNACNRIMLPVAAEFLEYVINEYLSRWLKRA